MITIYEIQKFLEQELNNTGSEELFKVYYWSKNYDKAYLEAGSGFYIKGQEEPQTYPYNKQYILSRIVDYDGSYEPIPNVLISNQSFALDFYFPTEQTEDIKYILNNFALSLKGRNVKIKDTSGKLYRTIFKADVPTFLEASIQHLDDLCGFDDRFNFERTKEYSIAEIRIYFTFTDNISMGNDFSYNINFTNDLGNVVSEDVYPISNSLGNSVELDSEQPLETETMKSTSKTNESVFQIQFYAKEDSLFTTELYERIFYGLHQDRQYTISPKGFSNLLLTLKCLIADISFESQLGRFSLFTITFKRSDE